MTDIVHQHNGQWWFWDDTLTTRAGPFATKEAAEEGFHQYAQLLDFNRQARAAREEAEGQQ